MQLDFFAAVCDPIASITPYHFNNKISSNKTNILPPPREALINSTHTVALSKIAKIFQTYVKSITPAQKAQTDCI